MQGGEELIVCSTCKVSKPKSDFMKGNKLMKTCSSHRVSREANSTWSELAKHIKQAKAKGISLRFRGRFSFNEFQPFALVKDKSDTRTRSRACKKMLVQLHRMTGYRFAYRNTWRLEDSWVAKCACVQDDSWDDTKVFKPKTVATLDPHKKAHCESGLTIRIFFSIRVFEIDLAHEGWHEAALPVPPASGKKGSKPDKIGGGGDDEDEDDSDDEEGQAANAALGGLGSNAASAAALAAAAGFGGPSFGGAGPSTAMGGGIRIPAFLPAVQSNANADSYNHCLNTLRRTGEIMQEFRDYMLQGNNFSQFRGFFDGIEQLVALADAERGR